MHNYRICYCIYSFFFVYFAINKPITIEMKHFVGISLFLLAQPMVAAEAPMSYVRFTTPDPLAL